MYLQHFQLAESPFALTPNLLMYFHFEKHEEAMRLLEYGLSQGECLMTLIGEIGLGKTLLCRQMLNTLGEGYQTCYIFNPCLSGNDLLHAIMVDLGCVIPEEITRFNLIDALSNYLLKQHEAMNRVVLIIDEAHLLNDEAMEVLRLLTNLETDTSKLLQIILVGQPELDVRLNTPAFRQIQQRIAYSTYLTTLEPNLTESYLMRRLVAAGHKHGQIFTKLAIRSLNRYASGVPRIINILCNKAMLIAYSQGRQVVNQSDIKEAANDSPNLLATRVYYKRSQRKRKRFLKFSLAAISAVAFAGLAVFNFKR